MSRFLRQFSRGAPKGERGLLARPRAAFCGGAKKLRFIALFLGGTANPEGGGAEAEARRAASAQAAFPARRAREKKGVEKEKEERNQSRTAKRNPTSSRPFNKGKIARKGVLLHRAGSGSLILGPPGAFFLRIRGATSGNQRLLQRFCSLRRSPRAFRV